MNYPSSILHQQHQADYNTNNSDDDRKASLRRLTPTLQPAACSSVALVATLPLHLAQSLIDHIIRTIEHYFTTIHNKTERSSFLHLPGFHHVISEIFNLLELCEMHLQIQLLQAWLFELLIPTQTSTSTTAATTTTATTTASTTTPGSTSSSSTASSSSSQPVISSFSNTNPILEQILFGSLRRNYQQSICLGMEQTIKTRLVESQTRDTHACEREQRQRRV